MSKPAGLTSKYPNVLNYEGVHGLENLKFGHCHVDFMLNDLMQFYVRMSAGPMDYTPGAMDNYPNGGYKGTTQNPGALGTRCHQLALMSLYLAPLQMLCDAPMKYEANRECLDYMRQVPTVWDDTVAVDGEPTEFAVAARRSGDAWWCSGICSWNGKSYTLEPKFLSEGEWIADIFEDADDAAQFPTHYVHKRLRVTNASRIPLTMAPGGGFAIRFVLACGRSCSPRVAALDSSAWKVSQWLSAKDAPVYDGPVRDGTKAAPGTSWFVRTMTNAAEVTSARLMTAGLGVYEVYVNGRPVGEDYLKPGFTHRDKTKYAFASVKIDCRNGQYSDWLSFEDYEPCNGSAYVKAPDGSRQPRPEAVRYWEFLGGCYWLMDARMLSEMAMAVGEEDAARRWRISAERALAHLRANFIDPKDGLLIEELRHLQGAALFALHCDVLPDEAAITATKAAYRKNLSDHDGCNMTGFLGTSILMETLTENGMVDLAYDLLLNRKFPSWLYSVDQGATTVWERWNSYTKDRGFGPVGMNSFNHYAYGAVLAWIYKTAAGIEADPKKPGFRNVIMAPMPDRRLGFVRAEYQSAAGLIKSAWRYDGDMWVWKFSIPKGATADVTVPGEASSRRYEAGSYTIRRRGVGEM